MSPAGTREAPAPAAGPRWLDERLARGELIIIDGAMGTELQARGVPMHGITWSAHALLEHGDVTREIHEEYIRAGADVIIANTFSTARHMLEPVGLGAEVGALNRRAVALACEARDAVAERPIAIAGSISNFMADERDAYWLDPARLRATFDEQASLLAAAGADLLALEMLERPAVARVALEAAKATGLPVWAGISARTSPEDQSKMVVFDYPEVDIRDLIETVVDCGPGVVNVMHCEFAHTVMGLQVVREAWRGPLGAYPNAGTFHRPQWEFRSVAEDEIVAAARSWVREGAQIIGGCCGLGPAHIRALCRADLRHGG